MHPHEGEMIKEEGEKRTKITASIEINPVHAAAYLLILCSVFCE